VTTIFIADKGSPLMARLESNPPPADMLLTVDAGNHWQTSEEVLLHPDDIIHDDDSLLLAEAKNKAFRGAEFPSTLKLPSSQHAPSLVPSHHNPDIGEKIGIKLDADHVVAFRRG